MGRLEGLEVQLSSQLLTLLAHVNWEFPVFQCYEVQRCLILTPFIVPYRSKALPLPGLTLTVLFETKDCIALFMVLQLLTATRI